MPILDLKSLDCLPFCMLQTVDAWEGLWQHRGIRGSWDPQLGAPHIKLLELWAVLFTLRHFRQELSGRHILVRTDNTQWYF